MVRIIVGTLIEIGLGKKSPESLELALKSKDRSLTGPTAAPRGLCLKSVTYPEAFEIFASKKSLAKPIAQINGDC
jgi:tRNA pseudouridine38-40 synthase